VGAARAVAARRSDRTDRAIMTNVNKMRELGIKGKGRMLKLRVLLIAGFIAFYFGHTALNGIRYSGMCTSVNFTD
jgi:hypothetical protein